MNTYKQIINKLLELSESFANIDNAEYMQFEKFEQKVKGNKFPFVAVQSNTYSNNTSVIQIHYVDQLDNEEVNLLQIHSDFLAFTDYLDQNFKHSISFNSQFYYKVLGEQCAGGQITMNIKLSNLC